MHRLRQQYGAVVNGTRDTRVVRVVVGIETQPIMSAGEEIHDAIAPRD